MKTFIIAFLITSCTLFLKGASIALTYDAPTAIIGAVQVNIPFSQFPILLTAEDATPAVSADSANRNGDTAGYSSKGAIGLIVIIVLVVGLIAMRKVLKEKT